ncbi:MAG: fumarylacetoacetate hydrolase family protein [Acidobacteria bacterium]|nr:fumarylacetoacetate hydrolase family protein [Acidobacteriota bacterium]
MAEATSATTASSSTRSSRPCLGISHPVFRIGSSLPPDYQTCYCFQVALIAAADQCAPIEPFSSKYGPLTLEQAAAIRQAWLYLKMAAGHRPRGKKIGAVERRWRSHAQALEPGWGHILDSTLLVDGTALPASHLIQPRVEAEFAFLLARDLAGPGVTAAHALASTAGVCAAFEVIDSRFRPKAPTKEDATADNAFHAYAVVGAQLVAPLDLDLAAFAVRLEINGEAKGTGSGANILGNPVHALVALANVVPLHGGEIILTGSVAGAFPIGPGDQVRAEFDRLGAITLKVE